MGDKQILQQGVQDREAVIARHNHQALFAIIFIIFFYKPSAE
jgi:hypothetical protein